MILERGTELAELASLTHGAESSGGRVVLIRGEAGIGKSTLINCFLDESRERADTFMGTCDDLLTPRPLGPIWDIAPPDSTLRQSLTDGDRTAVMQTLLELLSSAQRPTVMVMEDTQWADEATLDVIKFLGRRIARANGLLILTYRDVEVDQDHPLRRVIGELPHRNLVRMPLSRLSVGAVTSMIESESVDIEAVMSLSDGNPLFVVELITSQDVGVPLSIQDSVLARTSKVSTAARRALELLSVIPGESETALLESLLGRTGEELIELERQGLLRLTSEKISFRHELQRRAVESSLSLTNRRRLNRQVLTAMIQLGRDPSLLVHHACEAADIEAIIEFAPLAANAALKIESHREAVAQFRTLEPYLDRMEEAERAGILDQWARAEFYLDNADALHVLTRAIKLWRTLGEDRALAQALTFSVRVNELHGYPDVAAANASEAVTILQREPPSADLALALSEQAWLKLMKGKDPLVGVELADRAIAMATTVGDQLTATRALMYKGSIEHSFSDRNAISYVEEAHSRAEAGGFRFEEAYALLNLGGLAADVRDMDRASDFTLRALNTATRYEIRPLEAYARAMLAEIQLWKGDFANAEDLATEVLGAHPNAEGIAWRILGTIQARRGRPDARAMLDRSWSHAEVSAELQNLDPTASALAEYLWLSDADDPAALARVQEVLDMGMQSGFAWPSGALIFWAWKLDLLDTLPDGLSNLYRLTIEGEWEAALDFWWTRGVAYESGLALMHGADPQQIEAIHIFEDLGATATANKVRKMLLARGTTVPRGKSRSTRAHSAGLTNRQAEVLDLLARGLSNAAIADELFISQRTAENHVSAVLMKLEVTTREAAVTAARDQGILDSQ